MVGADRISQLVNDSFEKAMLDLVAEARKYFAHIGDPDLITAVIEKSFAAQFNALKGSLISSWKESSEARLKDTKELEATTDTVIMEAFNASIQTNLGAALDQVELHFNPDFNHMARLVVEQHTKPPRGGN